MTAGLMQCTALAKSGQRCTLTRDLSPAGLCAFHDPMRADEMRAMRQRGQVAAVRARAKKRQERLALLSETAGPRPPVGDSLDSIANWLRWLAEAAARGEIERRDLVALTNTARVLQGVYDKRDLQRQLTTLQRQVAELKKQNGRRS